MGLRGCASVAACLVLFTPACGGGTSAGTQAASPTHPEEVQTAEKTCLTGLMGLADATGFDSAQFAQTFCDYGEQAGLYDQGDTTWAELAPKLSEESYLRLIDHNCVETGNEYFDQAPEFLRKEIEVEINSAEWGRQFCRAYFDGQYYSEDGTVAPSGFARLVEDHVSLFTPFVVAGVVSQYQAGLGISREEFRRLAERTVEDAVDRGIVTTTSDPPFLVADQGRFQALLLRAIRDYKQGQ
jgi:hypothetical protein